MSVHNEILIVDDHFNQTDQENAEKICLQSSTARAKYAVLMRKLMGGTDSIKAY